MSKAMHRTAIVSDLHCGDVLGLTPPDYQESRYPFQKKMWDFYTSAAEQLGAVDDLIVNGDAVHGPPRKDAVGHSHPDVQDQTDMAEQAVSLIRAERRHFVRGTSFHTDGALNFENGIAKAFGLRGAEDEVRLRVHKTLFHYRHVVGRSDTPYGQHTQLQKEIINEMLQADLEDYRSADVVVRSHVHYCVKTGVLDASRGWMRYGYTTPALSLRAPKITPFVRKLRTWLYHVGITLIETSPTGEVFIRPHALPFKVYGNRNYKCVTRG